MRAQVEGGIVLWLAALAIPGCASTSDARYVYQDGQFGVVAIPKNTSQWPRHYREQAEALMARHFPQGYLIIRAEEVAEGSRILTRAGAGTAELAPQLPSSSLALLKVGGSVTRSQADTTSLKECRIIYKKMENPSLDGSGGYAPEPSLTPTCYLDPNTLARKQGDKDAKVETAAKKDTPRGDDPPARCWRRVQTR